MEMQHVRYFLALCDEQNFTRAARRCGVSQPSLTRAIMRLEAELGGALFERSRKITELTDLGRAVRPHFADIERAVANARREAKEQAAARAPKPFGTKDKPLRKAVVAAAVTAAILLVAGVARPPLTATVSSLPAPAQAATAGNV